MPTNNYVGSYTAAPEAAYAGQVQSSDFENIFSRQIETSAVGFGLAVGAGTADGSAKLGGTGFEGITTADKTQVTGDYQVGVTAGVINKGYVWVSVPVAVTPADTPYFIPGTGVVTNTSNTGANTAIPNAKFLNSAAANGMALLFIG